MVDTTKALDHVKSFAVRKALHVQPSLVVETDRVDDQRIAIPVADRISHPGWTKILRVLPAIGVDLSNEMVVLEQHQNSSARLNDLEWKGNEQNPRNAGRITAQIRIGSGVIFTVF